MDDPELRALAERLQGLCVARGLTLGAAESCTGGLLAATLTAIPGASAYFYGAIVSYAEAIKVGLLDVPESILAGHGAVSAQTARAMALGARERLGVSMAIAVTGIAGPDGGSDTKPVGLTYIGLADAGFTDVRRHVWTGDRSANRRDSVRAAIRWLIEHVETMSTDGGR